MWENNRPNMADGWAALKERILKRDQGVCCVCRRPGADSVDHVVPRARGGSDHPSNLRAIHWDPCHLKKTACEAADARWHDAGR